MSSPKDKSFRRFIWLLVAATATTILGWLLKWNVSLHDSPADATPNYTLLEPGLYIGGRSAAPPAGARVVLNLSQQADTYTVPIASWKPIADAAPAPSLDWLREQVAFIDMQRRAGETVFVHCDAGISRSALVVAAYLMGRNNWSCDRALAFMRQSRPVIYPNPAFRELLDQWEKAQPPTQDSATRLHSD